MNGTVCPPTEQLKALSLGQLSDEQSDDLYHHVRDCDSCQAELETVSDQEDSLIVDLRRPADESQLDAESGYPVAISKAMEVISSLSTSLEYSAAEPLCVPRTIGEYEIIRPLGRGGMGSVFLAQHTKLGRQVALKILVSHRLGDARMRERFEAEMRAVGRLSHPNIVTAHDAREVDGTAALVTEFIDGLDLRQLVQRTGPLAIADACELTRQVAVALQYTSQQGFVHRDVKPSNIMLSQAGEVKLLDLGLARLQFGEGEHADMTGTGQAMGTADYIAPEQVTDSRSVDVRADMYALGCTLFKLLTGRAPFADSEHATAFAKMTAHVSESPPHLTQYLPDAPAGLVKLLEALLAKSPEDRPQPQTVVERLSVFVAGAELQQLARRGLACNLEQPAARPHATTSNSPTQSSWKRPVSKLAVIASGFLGALLGFCLAIVITITNPDGTKTIIELATGSKVEISQAEAGHSSAAPPANADPQPAQAVKVKWQPYDEAKLQAERQAGRAVVLYITADWNLSGQAIKQLLDREFVVRLINGNDIMAMQADWTKPSEVIQLKLKELDADSVPLLAIYPADTKAPAIVLNDTPKEEEVVQALLQATSSGEPRSTGNVIPEDVIAEDQGTTVPLQFGLLVHRQDVDGQPKIDNLTLDRITDMLHKSDSSRIVQLDAYQFFSIDKEDVSEYPIVVWNSGWPYTLASTDPRFAIGWDEINGRILNLKVENETDNSSRTLNLTFDASLGERMRRLTEDANLQRLAVIVNNRVLAAPRINSTISSSVAVTGLFSDAELDRLRRGFASAQIVSATEVITHPSTNDPSQVDVPAFPSSGMTKNESTIDGVVTINGKPLSNAGVLFFPSEGGQRVLASRTDDQGKYRINATRINTGFYRVKIATGRDGYLGADGKPVDATEETVPARYNTASTISVEIKEGENELNFSLSSDSIAQDNEKR